MFMGKILFVFTAAFMGCAATVTAQVQSDTTVVASKDSLAEDGHSLDGVTVTAQRQLIKQEVDRIGYDVQADEGSKTQNVMDMLRKVPMVTVDAQDNILVRGSSNYRIYKNGHPDPSLSKNAKEIFKALPAASVKRIEVITDPGAREDAEGVGSILNIVMMDTRKMEGVTGNLTAGYSSLKHTNLGAYLATQLGKLILSFDYGYGGMSKKGTVNSGLRHRNYVKTGNASDYSIHSTNAGSVHYGDINASYELDSLNLFSASFGGYFYKLDVDAKSDISMHDRDGKPLFSYSESSWLPDYGHHSWNGRFDYEHKTRRNGEKLTLSYMLALTRQHTDQETNFSKTVNFPYSYSGYKQFTRERFTEHTFQIDYVRPLADIHKLEVGAKYISRRNASDTRLDYSNAPDVTSVATSFSHSINITAAYADYMLNVGRWSARAGLRYEYSYIKGAYPDGSGKPFDKRLNDWVPQLSLKYQIDDRQSLKLGYITSISRPGITYLNPAVMSTPLNVDYGNARLESAREQSLQFNYMYVGQKLTFQLVPQYVFSNNMLGSIVYTEGDTRYSTWGNVQRQHRFQIEGYAQWKPFAKTTFVANLNFSTTHNENTSANLSQYLSSLSYYAYVSQKLPWKLTAALYTYGQIGHTYESIYAYSRSWNVHAISLQRTFFSDDRLTVALYANNPFRKNVHIRTRTTQGDITGWSDNVNAQMGRMLNLTLSYRFGKLKASVKKTEITIENSDEVGGIKKGR